MWNSVNWIILGNRCVLITVLLITCDRQFVSGAVKNESAAKRLTDHLISNYGSPSIRPVVDFSKPVVVFFRILVSKIIEFDERLQQVDINAWRRQDWTDEFLQWDPNDYGGLESITFDYTQIWKPDLNLIENVDSDFVSVFDSDVILKYNGSISWYNQIIVSTSCKVHIRNFPYDTQSCNLTFTSWAYDSTSLDLQHRDDLDANRKVFLQNGVWSLRNVSVTSTSCQMTVDFDVQNLIVYTLYLERFSNFYSLNIVLPSVLLAFINCLVFMLPPASGERLSFAITNLLAVILFQQLVGGIMPPLGDEFPLLGMYFVFLIFTDCFILCTTIIVLRFHNKPGDKGVPKFLRKLCFLKTDDGIHGNDVFRKISVVGAKASDEENADDWKAVARMVDVYLFVLVTTVSVCFTVVTGYMVIIHNNVVHSQ